MKTITRENTWLPRTDLMDFGWGNGYVLIPKEHKLHGVHYNDIDVSVNGGLTFSEQVDAEMIKEWGLEDSDEGAWCIGFDTAHSFNTLADWGKKQVEEETESLKEQLLNYEV